MDSGSNQLHFIVRNKTELFSKETEVIWTERLKCQIELSEIFSQAAKGADSLNSTDLQIAPIAFFSL